MLFRHWRFKSEMSLNGSDLGCSIPRQWCRLKWSGAPLALLAYQEWAWERTALTMKSLLNYKPIQLFSSLKRCLMCIFVTVMLKPHLEEMGVACDLYLTREFQMYVIESLCWIQCPASWRLPSFVAYAVVDSNGGWRWPPENTIKVLYLSLPTDGVNKLGNRFSLSSNLR